MGSKHKWGWAALAAGMTAGLVFLSGCGTPGAPMPPSLHLPDRVTDLAASRTGNRVSLTWTMPKKDTDKLLLESDVQVRVCRKEGSGPCDAAGGGLQLEPGAEGAFTETLPPALANGAPRLLTYFVELNNRNGRSAGESNAGVVLAGEAPAAVGGLAATVRKDGVVLRWTPNSAAAGQAGRTAVRLHRKLLTPEADSRPKAQESLLAPPPEPVEQSLLVDSDPEAGRAPDRALDKGIRFGQSYEYRAQRVIRVTVDGRMLELAGPLSDAVRVEARDVFPPAVPTGLAAVATAAEAGGAASIDLSWQPGVEADLAGYAVYRREGEGGWQRVSPAEPIVGPAFRDAQVQAGHTYRYAVTAIDQGGHESARSAEAEETAPGP